jgi:hypothetical protein
VTVPIQGVLLEAGVMVGLKNADKSTIHSDLSWYPRISSGL